MREVEEMVVILEEIARMPGDAYVQAKISAIRLIREIYESEGRRPPTAFDALDALVRKSGKGPGLN